MDVEEEDLKVIKLIEKLMKIKRNLKKDKLVGGKRNIIIILILFILGISKWSYWYLRRLIRNFKILRNLNIIVESICFFLEGKKVICKIEWYLNLEIIEIIVG